jgi:hypothetical protein
VKCGGNGVERRIKDGCRFVAREPPRASSLENGVHSSPAATITSMPFSLSIVSTLVSVPSGKVLSSRNLNGL